MFIVLLFSECRYAYTQTHTYTARAGNSRRIISEMDISSVSVCVQVHSTNARKWSICMHT